jgi:hypothetical protein
MRMSAAEADVKVAALIDARIAEDDRLRAELQAASASLSGLSGAAEADAKVEAHRAELVRERLLVLNELESALAKDAEVVKKRMADILNRLDAVRMERARVIEGSKA